MPNIKNVKTHEILHAHRIDRDVNDDISLVLIFYRVTADFEGEVQISEEHVEHKWVTLDEVMQLAYPTVAVAIKAAYNK